MRPDDRRVERIDPDQDLEFAGLVAAGDRTRRSGIDGPAAGFARDLRNRLVAHYPVGAYVPADGGAGAAMLQPHPAWEARPGRTHRTGTALNLGLPLAAIPTPRWAIIAVAAAVIMAIAGLGVRGFALQPPISVAAAAVDAALIRDGSTRPLVAGTSLIEGDRIETTATGSATIELAGGAARLAGGTTLVIERITYTEIGLSQPAGRIWHRVGADAGTYRVRTGDVIWTANGTAFDLDHRFDRDGAHVRGVGVSHVVRIDGPRLSADLREGGVAVIAISDAGTPDAAMGDATPDDLADPWLRANARDDLARGWDVGIFDGLLADAEPLVARTTVASVRLP